MKTKISYDEVKLTVLSFDDIDTVMAIQEEAFAAMDDDRLLRRNTKETFSVCFESPSIAYGVKHNDKIVAFGMLYCAADTDENLAKGLDDVSIDLHKVANVKVIIVLPQYRGNGLQCYLINKLEEHAKKCGMKTLMATVSPLNNYSLDNFIACGYNKVKTVNKYGGLSRVLLRKDF